MMVALEAAAVQVNLDKVVKDLWEETKFQEVQEVCK
jgi:hypothetical protein